MNISLTPELAVESSVGLSFEPSLELSFELLREQSSPDHKGLVFKAEHPRGLQCTLFAQEHPIEGFHACVRVPGADAVVLRLNAVAGIPSGLLLSDLCEALSQGEARLEDPYQPGNHSCWAKSRILLATPYAPGQDVDLFVAKSAPQWSFVAARPCSDRHGKRHFGFNVYVLDAALAERLSKAIVTGKLNATVYS